MLRPWPPGNQQRSPRNREQRGEPSGTPLALSHFSGCDTEGDIWWSPWARFPGEERAESSERSRQQAKVALWKELQRKNPRDLQRAPKDSAERGRYMSVRKTCSWEKTSAKTRESCLKLTQGPSACSHRPDWKNLPLTGRRGEEVGKPRLSSQHDQPGTESCPSPPIKPYRQDLEGSQFPNNFTRSQDKVQEDSQDCKITQHPTR